MTLIGRKRSQPEPDADLANATRGHVEGIRKRVADLLVLVEALPADDALAVREFCDSVTDAAKALEMETKLLDGAPTTEPEAETA